MKPFARLALARLALARLAPARLALARLAFALLCLAAAGPATAQRVILGDPFAIPSATAPDEAEVYVLIQVYGPTPARLLAARSIVAASVELRHRDGAGSVPAPDGFTIPGNSSLSLDLGTDFLLLKGLKYPLRIGEIIPVTLTFETVGDVSTAMEVVQSRLPRNPDGSPAFDPDAEMGDEME